MSWRKMESAPKDEWIFVMGEDGFARLRMFASKMGGWVSPKYISPAQKFEAWAALVPPEWTGEVEP